MLRRNTSQKKSQLTEVLSVISKRKEFARDEILALCSESKPRFVTSVLKQLTSESVLRQIKHGKEPRFKWASKPEDFPYEIWIQRQLCGTQVTQAPKAERPRERLLDLGPQNLTTSELLAILIRSGRKGESAVQAGQKISSIFDSQLERLPSRCPLELKQISSAVSEVAYCQIMAGVELGRRVAEAISNARPKEKVNSTRAAIAYCSRQFARLAHDACQEEFHIVTLDTKLQPIQNHQITIGTLDASLVHPREVFRPAIRDAASAILLVHNHPSGDSTPSREDREITDRLKRSGALLGIEVIDHIIVAKDQTVSLAEAG